MAGKGFIFGGNTGETAESIAKKRLVADALMQRSMSTAPKNLGEGIAAVGQALAYRFADRRMAAQEKELREVADTNFAPLANADWSTPTTPGATGGNMPKVAEDGSVAPASSTFSPDIKSGISSTASSLGIDPVDLATAISYETGGTFDPTKKGPTTQWGQHRGLIQFGEPQAEKYGVNWDDPVGSQLGPDGAVAKYLKEAGVQPGMGMLDVYSAINAGKVGRYNASDAGNGGAPGTVADKVNKQMAGHRQKAMAMFAESPGADPALALSSAGTPQPQNAADAIEMIAPTQTTESLSDEVAAFRQTPEAQAQFPGRQQVADALRGRGIEAAPQAEAKPSVRLVADALRNGPPPASPQPSVVEALRAPTGSASSAPGSVADQMAAQAAQGAPMQPQAAPVGYGTSPNLNRIADRSGVGMGGDAPGEGYFPAAPPKVGESGPSMQQMLRVYTDPNASAEQRGYAEMLIKQRQSANDPNTRLEAEYKRAQIDALGRKTEKQWQRLDDNTLYSPETGETRSVPVDPNRPSSDLGLNPQYGVDAEGNPVLLQLGKDGRTVQSKMPDGVTLSKDPIRLDAGTHFVIMDPITRQAVATVPKNVAGEAQATVEGKATGEARANLGQMEDTGAQVLSTIDSLTNDPYLDSMIGSVQGRLPNWTSDAARVQGKMDQIQGQQFLQAFNSLRGAGQITEVEGKKATDAIAALNTAQNEKDYKAALATFRGVVETGMARARSKAGGQAPSPVPETPAGAPDATVIPNAGADPLAAARQAIAKGAPREKVIERLRQGGINPEGL
ncbi:hypothetical protein C8J35_103525 [Rhizobium sp. PP-F2F-G38]|nr:hypothetical protein C8J35_103525 [Rhizobium sp. PP-F2F-G38]